MTRDRSAGGHGPDPAAGRGPRRFSQLVALVLVAAVAAGLVALATRDGVSTGPDDAVYVGTARSVAHGHGPNVPFHMYPLGAVSIGTPPPGRAAPRPTPLVIYAPLQPHVLAIGDRPIGAARIESAAFLALAVLISGVIVLSATGALWAAVAAQLVIAFALADGPVASPGTEALALLLTVGAFALLLRHLERPRLGLLLGASALIGIATLERFAAGGLIVWAVLALALRRRHRDALILLVAGSAPLAAWFAYERVSGRTTGHAFGFHVVTNTARAAGRSVADWVLPSTTPLPVAMLAALAVIVTVALLVRRHDHPAVRLLALFAVVQIVILEVAVTFFDAGVNLEPREFVPIFAAVVLAVACAVGRTPAARPYVAAATALFVLGGAIVLVHPAHGYAESKWVHDRVLADVRALPPNAVIYTNAPDAVYLLAHRAVSSLPETKDFSTLERNPHFAAQMDEIRTTLAARGGYVVYVGNLQRDDFLPTERELRRELPLRLVRREADGAIYALAPGARS